MTVVHPALILTAHGSVDPRSSATTHAVADLIRRQRPGLDVQVAFCEKSTPNLGDVLARLGGDEFVFFMDVKSEEELHMVADRLERSALKESPCQFSVGRAYRLPGETMKTVLQRADSEMYRQKKGRGSGKTLRMRPIIR